MNTAALAYLTRLLPHLRLVQEMVETGHKYLPKTGPVPVPVAKEEIKAAVTTFLEEHAARGEAAAQALYNELLKEAGAKEPFFLLPSREQSSVLKFTSAIRWINDHQSKPDFDVRKAVLEPLPTLWREVCQGLKEYGNPDA